MVSPVAIAVAEVPLVDRGNHTGDSDHFARTVRSSASLLVGSADPIDSVHRHHFFYRAGVFPLPVNSHSLSRHKGMA